MSKEIIIDREYPGYTFLGWAEGQFDADDQENGGKIKQSYWTVYVASPVSTWTSEDYHAAGLKAEKKKCATKVWDGISIGDKMRLFFDDKQRVVMMALDG